MLENQNTYENVADDFLWEDQEYSASDKAKMAEQYEQTLSTVSEKQIMTGVVVAMDDKEVVVNIGFKSDGVLPLSEFRDVEDLKVGSTVEVFLQKTEDSTGKLLLSRKMANSLRTWEKINSALDTDIIMEGIIKRRTKGGFVVDLEGVEAFLPGSQIDVKPIRDYDSYVGQRMEFKVVKINHTHNNVVISHKVLIEKDLEEQKAEIINKLERGQILEGVVKNITNFGVFIDLGGVDGLLHITDISWGRINTPEEVLQLDGVVKVVVLDFDDDKRRISLGMKQLMPHPWDTLTADIHENSIVSGKVVTIADYGIFIEIVPGVEGLIHVSEMSWSQHLKNPYEIFNIGDTVEAKVLTIDREERKMSLGVKQLTEDPWAKVPEKYALGTQHKAIVRNITNYGLFVELEEGVDGLIHVQDLSWSKINHPQDFTKKDEELDVVVIELDLENRKIKLGHKQLTEDPWATFETIFFEGSIHEATIVKMVDKSAILELQYGVEGFVPSKHLQVADGQPELRQGDKAQFKVIEFNRENRRIVLSHSDIWKQEKENEASKSSDDVKEVNKKNDKKKDTLGDNDVLAALKNKLENDKK